MLPGEVDSVKSIFPAECQQFFYQLFSGTLVESHLGEALGAVPPAHAQEQAATVEALDLLQFLQDGRRYGLLVQPPPCRRGETEIDKVSEGLEGLRGCRCHTVVWQVAGYHELILFLSSISMDAAGEME